MLAILIAGAVVLGAAAPARAHVVPSTTVALDVHADSITASLVLPTTDLETASGIALPPAGAGFGDTETEAVAAYLVEHFRLDSAEGSWTVTVANVAATTTEQYGTPEFDAVTATATLTPPDPADLRRFTLDYDAIIHQVVTADIFVTLHSDWAAGILTSNRVLGAITLDTVTGTVPTLAIDLDDGSSWRGFTGMLTLGISHIAEGTDHQLFLLTLLLPAPLLAVRRRWAAVASTGTAVRRITTITIAFTLGHSATLALGALGLPVPQRPIEALIAVSILVAAAHAIRRIFPGREAWIAAGFGVVHGMAFSETLSELGLSGRQLAISLLGFNLGIELMQLAVVLLVLPPLLVPARTPLYPPLRVGAATVAGIAAIGWLLARIGLPNPIGHAADSIGAFSPWLVLTLWIVAIAALPKVRATRSLTPAEPRANR